ncbi:hypothetical protein [Escherichia coli]
MRIADVVRETGLSRNTITFALQRDGSEG